MSMNEKTDLDFEALSGPVRSVSRPEKAVGAGKGPEVATWPSRSPAAAPEPVPRPKVSLEAQVSIRGPHEIIERFKASCQIGRARLSYYDKISVLLDLEDKLAGLEIGGRNADPMDILNELIENYRNQ